MSGKLDACRILGDLARQEAFCISQKVMKPLILYGAGDLGKMARRYFDQLGISIRYVIDRDPERYVEDPFWTGISILKPDEAPSGHRKESLLAICVATVPYMSIYGPLLKQGWQDIVPFYDISEAYTDSHPLSNGWFTGELTREDIEGIEFVINHLSDEISLSHYLQFIAWHRLRKEILFEAAPVTRENRFFIPEVLSSLHKSEVFIDGGAHYGEVSLRFINLVDQRFEKIYVFEPDKYNIKELRRRLSSEPSLRRMGIEIVECALGQNSGKMPFYHGLDYYSQFSPLANESVLVRTLNDMNIPATFIKLHLEGWEYEALLGAMNCLIECRPILTVTTYHKRNGLWEIPSLLMKQMRDYLFFFRIHSWMGTGSVLYAIPRERFAGGF